MGAKVKILAKNLGFLKNGLPRIEKSGGRKKRVKHGF
jgi:hypothetical protein